ncbi:MAG: GIY-YIG nuclease family protein [Syntrophomonadaceae bacterium]|jgi:putative endonuclease
MFYVYILLCADQSLYTGYTTDINKRVVKHNLGKASKYTRSRLPVKCVYVEEYETKSDALKREREIKKLSHKLKQDIIQGYL